MPTRTEQHAYPFNHQLNALEENVNAFFSSALTLDKQLYHAEKLLVAANRVYTMVKDTHDSAAANPHAQGK